MDATSAALLAGFAGLVTGALAVVAVRYSERQQTEVPETEVVVPALPAGAADVLAVLRSSAIVVDSADRVINNSPPAVAYGLVRGSELVHHELRHLARQVRRDGVIRETELELARGPLGQAHSFMRARVAPFGSKHVLLLVDDHTQERRVEEVRRDFVANVSHELKTPIGALSLLAETIADESDPEVVKRLSSHLRDESFRVSHIVDDLLTLSRIEGDGSIVHVPVAISSVVDEAVARVRPVAEHRNVAIDVQPVDPAVEVEGDRSQLTSALFNLLDNAVKYSEGGSNVEVEVEAAPSTVVITVRDHGIGIPSRDLERIFERFYRVDKARSRETGGTGLGLSIVRHAVQNHGGEVTVTSREGEGSTFVVTIPRRSTP